MYYELALMSVVVAGGYWGWYFARQQQLRLYGGMLILSAVLSGLGLLGVKAEIGGLGIVGAVGVGGGLCLLVVGPLTRGLARRFAIAEHFGLAQRMLDVADVLAPGSGVAEEKALLGAMREIRDGNIEHVVDALSAAKTHAKDDARLAIDERIAMLYLTSYRWDDAIAHAEANLFGAVPPDSAPANPALGLRGALGLAPPVWVELLGAYGYRGDLDQAARMLARLEDVCAGRDDATIWLHRGRLVFLALAGRVGAVQALVEPRRSRHMKAQARSYWLAVAHERHGDGPAAEAAYTKARARSRGKPRELIDQALARLPTVRAAELGPTATELIARVEAQPVPAIAARMRPPGPWMSQLLVGVVLATAVAIAALIGSSNDVGVLMRAGAVVRGLVRGGEWWRLVSCMFVHVGGAHLVVNAVGLWFIGRLAEELFGPRRLLAIFALSGLVGTIASCFAAPAGVAAGVSGAIFGIVGATFVELTLHRKRHGAAWTRAVWGSLAVVTIAEIGVGFLYPVTDQWAHGGGLVAGALAGALLSPNARWHRAGKHVALAIGVAFAALVAVSAVQVARTSIADSLAAAPTGPRDIDGVHVVAPLSWTQDHDELFDPDLFVLVALQREPSAGPFALQLAAYEKGEPERAKDRRFEDVADAGERVVSLPDGWTGSELAVSVTDALDSRQQYRVIVAGRPGPTGGGAVFASIYVPLTVARAAPDYFTHLLESVQ